MRDAVAIWRSWTARPWPAALLVLLFASPFLSGVLGRIVRGRSFFTEYESIACAAERANAGLPYYGEGFACAGMQAQPFVYLPWVAESAAALLRVVGPDGLRAAYVAFYVVAFLFLVWLVFLRRATPGERLARVPFLALITGSAIAVGNIAIPIAALIAAAGLLIVRTPWLFILVVAAAGAVKPFQLTYLILVPLAAAGGLVTRGVWSVLAAVVGLGAFAFASTHGGAALDAWRAQASLMAFDVAPGEGYFGWLSVFGPLPGTIPLALGYVVYAGLLAGAGLAVAVTAKLEKAERVWLGFTLATLLTPRLMQIDLLLLGPGLLALIAATPARSRVLVSWLVMGGAFAALLLGVADAGDYALKVATLAFAAAILVAGATALQSTAKR